MGRGVATLRNAEFEVYVNFEREYDEDGANSAGGGDNEWYWEDFKARVTNALRKAAPSLSEEDGWEDNEVRIIMANGIAQFAVAEYCGIASISGAALHCDYYTYLENFGAAWLSRVRQSLEQELVKEFGENVYGLAGRFSNGECVYSQLTPATKGEIK